MIEHKRDSFDISDSSLKILSSGLNDEQLSAVKKTGNVVVSAGAGSGKTTVLASRYAYLIEAKNIPCDRILTLTFTKKAANEMKERIFKGLRFHLQGKDVKGKKNLPPDFEHLDEIKARAQSAIESFDKSHIQTLDSYFSEIAKKGARYYGINPNFVLDDDKINSAVSFKATKYVLEHLDCEEIKEIAQIFQIQNVAEELFARSILKFSTVLTPIDFKKSLDLQKKRLLKDYEKITALIKDEIAAFILLPKSSKPSATLQKLYGYIEEFGNPEAPSLPQEVFESEKIAKSFLQEKFFTYCRSISGYCGSAFSRGPDDYKIFKKNLLPLIEKLYLIANSISGFDLQKRVFAHLAAFQEDVNRTKRTAGILSFSDVSQLALSSLSDHDEIRHIEQQKFDAIMIDEFQDDNSLQCDVLLILSDAHEKYDEAGRYVLPRLSDSDLSERLDSHKLFFVGDDKQSIYRFRGADVSVFRSLSASIPSSIQLKTNYRSDPELIRSFNSFFGGYDYPSGEEVNDSLPAIFMTNEKFPPRPDGSAQIPDYEADYKRVEVPSFKLEKCDFSQKKVTVALYPAKVDESSINPSSDEESEAERKIYECEASFVAREINKLLQEKDENGSPKYHRRDIALLFRTATPAAPYENTLLAAEIPYSTEVYKGFFSDGPINDIISLLKLCVYPEDKNAFSKVLRSPFCSLTFAELEKVLVNTEEPYKSPFDEKMLGALAEDGELNQKILRLKSIYDDINSRLKTEKLTKTISYIWYELGYRYETLWNKSVSMYASFYDILFEMARLAEDKTESLASFIDMVKSYEESDRKLDGLDVVMDAEDAVQILTIHKSKGLEFKVVFVCAVSARSRGGMDSTVFDKDFGFLLKTPAWKDYDRAAEELPASGEIRKNIAQNYCMSWVQKENDKQESAELRRLAYVAFTRAEEKLYIVGSENGEFEDEEKSAEKAVPKTMYQLLLPLLYQFNTENGVNHPAFNFVNDRESFAPISIEKSDKIEKSDFIASLPDPENMAVEQEELSPKIYLSPSKLKKLGGGSLPLAPIPLTTRKRPEQARSLPLRSGISATPSAGDGSGIAFTETRSKLASQVLPAKPSLPTPSANGDYSLINLIVASTVPAWNGELSLEDEGEEGDRHQSEQENPQELLSVSPLFNFTNFGTIAHAYMEGKVLSKEAVISGREWIGMNESFIPKVGMEKWPGETNREKKIAKIRELCADMADKFENSSIYKEASAASWKRTEYSFRCLVDKSFLGGEDSAEVIGENYAEDLIVTGQIDLVYKNDADSKYKYTIVDYKTNQKIEPELYYSQLACYRKAISQMLGAGESEIRCVLYYLRFAAEVDVTEHCRA